MAYSTKPSIGFFTFTCCEGCSFTILFIDKILEILSNFEIKHFNLLKECDQEAKINLAFVEGAITTTTELEQLKKIRKNSEYVVALGTCACNGGIPAMRNFVDSQSLRKYVYHHHKHPDILPATGIGEHIKVDHFLKGCPIIKNEFVEFATQYLDGKLTAPFKGSVCDQCPRRGKNCLLKEKAECLGAITNGGCDALCPSDNIPCMLCRGPTDKANVAAEIRLFEKFGLEEKEIHDRLNLFKNIEES